MIYLIVGPPAAGKTSWACAHAQPGDFIIDFDRITASLSPGNPYHQDQTVLNLTRHLRWKAIKYLVGESVRSRKNKRAERNVYITKCRPGKKELKLLKKATIVVIDPGKDIVMERAKRLRPPFLWKVVEKWYAKPPL